MLSATYSPMVQKQINWYSQSSECEQLENPGDKPAGALCIFPQLFCGPDITTTWKVAKTTGSLVDTPLLLRVGFVGHGDQLIHSFNKYLLSTVPGPVQDMQDTTVRRQKQNKEQSPDSRTNEATQKILAKPCFWTPGCGGKCHMQRKAQHVHDPLMISFKSSPQSHKHPSSTQCPLRGNGCVHQWLEEACCSPSSPLSSPSPYHCCIGSVGFTSHCLQALSLL
jgi:hypothetical protein